ncbi:MAG: bifunctional oligoribonuclease/PAP phosphatase NrnA [Clostridia bacterium]
MKISYEEAAKYLSENDSYLILTHKNPDGDTLGSACALCRGLRSAGKQAFVLENAGATARYTQYLDGLIAEDSYIPSKIIAVDIADTKLFPPASCEYGEKVDLVLDHHVSHKSFAAHELVDADAAACGEIIWTVLKLMGAPLNREIANAIYVAISTDTSCFLNSNTTAHTHETAAQLYAYGIDFEGINRTFFVVKTRARLAVEARLISNMRFYLDGKLAVMEITKKLVEETGADEDDLDNISSLARSIEGVEVGMLIRERVEGESKISMRSSSYADVAKICGHFGGGGHIRAAGCAIKMPTAEAEAFVVATIMKEKLL